MLDTLSIRDVVLIESLTLDFADGLNALSGETGAGKSILLDALGLALGQRADSALVRAGAEKLSVTASFSLPRAHPALTLLSDNDLPADDATIIVRRTVTSEGRSKAYVNDAPVSAGLLRALGERLVEVHGQFDAHGLLDPKTHLGVLDDLADTAHLGALSMVEETFAAWHTARKTLEEVRARLARAQDERDFLTAAVEDLTALAPKADEEETLASKRTALMSVEKIMDGLQTARDAMDGAGVEPVLRSALTALERVQEAAGGKLDAPIAALDRALIETGEAVAAVEAAAQEVEADPSALEQVETRLFDLRAIARKHGVGVCDLPDLLARFQEDLDALEDGEAGLARLIAAEQSAADAYDAAANNLTTCRRATAARLEQAVGAELPPLKLDKARFSVAFAPTDQRTSTGLDRVAFQIATNPGATPGPLNKIASGGELARLMLALRVVMAQAGSIPALVFDEVDAGVGGATAAAVGARLERLAQDVQVLVVTHAPQVAARADRHLLVAKSSPDADRTITSVTPLSDSQRREEIARMLAGSTITDAARAAADQLLDTPS